MAGRAGQIMSGAPDGPIQNEAVAWLVRLQDQPTPATRHAHAAWLQDDPRHAAAWSSLNQTWDLAGQGSDRVLRDDAAALTPVMDRIRATRRRRAGRRNLMLALMMMALGGASGWSLFQNPHLLQDLRADQVASRGERRVVVLPDGSTVLLDADSALATDFSDRRRVRLLRGTAWFDVRHDGRPFTVAAGNGEISVLGTAFDVDMAGDTVSVTLERGEVRVTVAQEPPVTLHPGQQVGYGDGRIDARQTVDLAETQSWHTGWFTFNDARFADVIARIERQRPGRILILAPGLAEQRISGGFSLDAPQAALESLRNTMGFPLRHFGSGLIVIGP